MCRRYTGLLRVVWPVRREAAQAWNSNRPTLAQRRPCRHFLRLRSLRGQLASKSLSKAVFDGLEIAVSTLDSTALAARLKIGPAAGRGERSGSGRPGFAGGNLCP